ncbi:cell wall-binding repeat-containing protein [Diaminobutyricibacter sp. McL0608]|uniref:cell wall-binding repeat-containing protein n=1 Tax=Leifsonia sp. McL0608 TaxID=3143537 RepID=UPI0031F33106
MRNDALRRIVGGVILATVAALAGVTAAAPAQAVSPSTPATAIRRLTLPDAPVTVETLADAHGNVWNLEERGISMAHDGVVTYFRDPAGRYNWGFALDPQGNAWYTNDDQTSGARFVTRITSTGQRTDYAVSLSGGISAGPDGTMWFIGAQGGVLRISASGGMTAFSTPQITESTFSSDGTLWFGADTTLGWISPSQVSAVAGTAAISEAGHSMIVAVDGSVWFADGGGVGEITPSHVVSEFEPPGSSYIASNLVQGSDGNIWFEWATLGKVAKVTSSGQFTSFDVGGLSGNMVLGPGGDLWLSDALPNPAQGLTQLDDVVRISSAGAITRYRVSIDTIALTLTMSPDGTLWFQSQDDGRSFTTAPSFTATISSDGVIQKLVDNGIFAGGVAFDTEGHAWTLDYMARTLDELQPISTSRVSGTDRFGTSVAIARQNYPQTAPIVFVASGINYPDALSAGPAAAAMGGPLLLTSPGSLPAVVADEITSLAPAKIVVVGGPGAISDSVLTQLRAIAPTTRVFASDRYGTSRAIVREFFPNGASAAYVATGSNFPDALSAGAAAGAHGQPLLLVNGSATTVDTATADLLTSLGVKHLTIAGGTGSVSAGFATHLSAIAPTTRAAGADRFSTAAAINEAAFSGSPVDRAMIANGLNFPDALGASAWAAATKSPLFISGTSCVPSRTIGDIIDLTASAVTIIGGIGALSANVDNLASC